MIFLFVCLYVCFIILRGFASLRVLWTEVSLIFLKMTLLYLSSSAESQKGVNDVQRCSVENQKGAIAIEFVMSDSALLVLNGTLLNSDKALVALNWRTLFCQTIVALSSCVSRNLRAYFIYLLFVYLFVCCLFVCLFVCSFCGVVLCFCLPRICLSLFLINSKSCR